jgi:hypothetical protein
MTAEGRQGRQGWWALAIAAVVVLALPARAADPHEIDDWTVLPDSLFLVAETKDRYWDHKPALAGAVGPRQDPIALQELLVRAGRPDLWERHVAAEAALAAGSAVENALYLSTGAALVAAAGLGIVSATMGEQLTDRYGAIGAAFLPAQAGPVAGLLLLSSGAPFTGAMMVEDFIEAEPVELWEIQLAVDEHNSKVRQLARAKAHERQRAPASASAPGIDVNDAVAGLELKFTSASGSR